MVVDKNLELIFSQLYNGKFIILMYYLEIVKRDRTTSWYTECGLFKNTESRSNRPSSYWYAEVGLYQTNHSTPSTSSAENSGTNTNLSIKPNLLDTVNMDNGDEYYNMKNESFCNRSTSSSASSDTKIKQSSIYGSNDMHLRLEEEPLYQFYDAARMDVRNRFILYMMVQNKTLLNILLLFSENYEKIDFLRS